MDPITFDQLRVFLHVADEGSFSAAARSLHRAQSAVSYAIGNLERLLGVTLFTRGSRAPALTDAGKGLLADARAIHGQVQQLTTRASRMAQGLEPRLTLAVEATLPMPVLVAALDAFRAEFPSVPIVLHTETLGAVAQMVLDGTCRVGISGELPRFPDGLSRWPLLAIPMVNVAAAAHPLARLEGPIPTSVLQQHVQLVISDRSRLTEGVDFGVLGTRTWRLADLGTKHAFLRAGFGWGGMPQHVVADDLAAGTLVRIQPLAWVNRVHQIPLDTIFRSAEPPGPAGRWFLERLAALAARCPAAGALSPASLAPARADGAPEAVAPRKRKGAHANGAPPPEASSRATAEPRPARPAEGATVRPGGPRPRAKVLAKKHPAT